MYLFKFNSMKNGNVLICLKIELFSFLNVYVNSGEKLLKFSVSLHVSWLYPRQSQLHMKHREMNS